MRSLDDDLLDRANGTVAVGRGPFVEDPLQAVFDIRGCHRASTMKLCVLKKVKRPSFAAVFGRPRFGEFRFGVEIMTDSGQRAVHVEGGRKRTVTDHLVRVQFGHRFGHGQRDSSAALDRLCSRALGQEHTTGASGRSRHAGARDEAAPRHAQFSNHWILPKHHLHSQFQCDPNKS